VLKRELMRNAFNQEASVTAANMVNSSKMSANNLEVETIINSRPTQVLKTKKPEQILMEVRSKKIQELNQYKEVSSEKKY